MGKEKNNDKQVLALQEVVRQKKAAIAKAEKPTWLTNCSLAIAGGNRINLHVTRDLDVLALVLGTLSSLRSSYELGRSLLSLDFAEFKYEGYSYIEWISDIQTRVAQIQIGEEKAKLEKAEKALENLLSKELKQQKELEELTELLK